MRIEKFNCGGRVWSPQLLADLKAHLDGPIVLAVGSFDTAPDEDDITWYRSNEWPSSVVVMADGKSVFTFWNITTEKQ